MHWVSSGAGVFKLVVLGLGFAASSGKRGFGASALGVKEFVARFEDSSPPSAGMSSQRSPPRRELL